MWFISVEVEQATSAPPPKKNPGSAPDIEWCFVSNGNAYELVLGSLLKRLENMILHFHFVINLED